MHQGAVDTNTQVGRRFQQLQDRLEAMATTTPSSGNGKPKDLIEAKQVEVKVFSGAVTDSRQTFMKWAESIRDRCVLFDANLAKAMKVAVREVETITEEKSVQMGVGA